MSATLLAVIAAVAGLAALLRKRRPADPPDEPWRQSLEEDDEPLDLESIRQAEEEFLAEGGAEDDDEPWR